MKGAVAVVGAVVFVVVVEAFRCGCCKFALVLKLIVCLGLLISTL